MNQKQQRAIKETNREITRKLQEIRQSCLWQIDRLQSAIACCDGALEGKPTAIADLSRIEGLGDVIDRQQGELKVFLDQRRFLEHILD